MKAKEKGIALSTNAGTGPPGRKGFNAFKLMAEEEKLKKKAGKVSNKDEEMDDAEPEKEAVTIIMEGKTYTLNEDGEPDESELEYPKNRVLKFTGAGDGNLDFKTIKVGD